MGTINQAHPKTELHLSLERLLGNKRAMDRNTLTFPPVLDPTRHFQMLLLNKRSRLHEQIRNLREIARNINKLRRRSLIANITGSSLSAVGAITTIVGLSLSPATLGASLLASAVGLGIASAGGAVSVTSDLSLVLSNSRELRRVQEITVNCQNQMREILSCLEFLHHGQGPMDPILLQSEKNASISLYNSLCFMVFYGSHNFLVPQYTREVTKVSQAVVKAKIQKLAENLESCARALNEVCELLESRAELSSNTTNSNSGARIIVKPQGSSS